MQEITLWYKYDRKKNEWIYNHFDYKHLTSDYPEPIFKSQNSWKSEVWSTELKHIKEGVIC